MFNRSAYWEKRKHLIYYQIVEKYVRYVARDAKSLMDVGGTSPFIEWFDWVDELYALDIAEPYRSDRVTGIKTDLFAYKPERRFDVVTCLQVLEHLDNPKRACNKMKKMSDHLVVSVPYKWDPSITYRSGHVQDPVDLDKLNSWMGKKPVDSTVVNEPFLPRWPRLVAWYAFTGSRVKVDHAVYRASQKPIG